MNKVYKENAVVVETIVSTISEVIQRVNGETGSIETTRQMVAASLQKQLSRHIVVPNA